MIDAREMKKGLVVRDPEGREGRKLFRLRTPLGIDGPWPAIHCSSGRLHEFQREDLERLTPIGDEIRIDIDVRALIGHKVALDLAWGTTITGTLQRINGHAIEFNHETHHLPAEFVIGGESYKIEQIEGVRMLEDDDPDA